MARIRSTTLAAGALLVLASCAMAGASPTPQQPTSRPPSPTAAALAPTATAQPIPTQTPAPTAAVTATDHWQAPPLGGLSVPDGSAVPGHQAAWCYEDACADGIPPARADLPRIDAPANADLLFTLADTHPFVYWTVDYALEQDDGSTTRLAEGGTYVDPDTASATSPPELTTFNFEAPPAGDWVLAVNLQFADGLGDSIYLWHVVVE